MHPILFKIFSLTIYTYGFFVALGFLSGILVAQREAKLVGESPEKIVDISFYIILFGIIGARIFYIITDLKPYLDNPIEIFKIWNGGMTFYGGFLAAFLGTIIYMKKNNMPLLKTADILAPSAALGHFFGRIGCFSAGCCYGKECDLPWAVTFSDLHSLAPLGIYLHPTQLYEAASNLFIFIIIMTFKKFKKIDGQIFFIYLIFYGLARTAIEFFRGDFRGVIYFGFISVSQLIGSSIAILSFITIIYISRKAKK